MRVSEMHPESKKAYYWLIEQELVFGTGKSGYKVPIAEYIEGNPEHRINLLARATANYLALYYLQQYNKEHENAKTKETV